MLFRSPGTEIVRGVDLAIDTNEVHAVMGPNGSGKSTLAYALMGHPAYEVTEGEILIDGENLVEMAADERAQRGLFLAFQYPHAVPGVTVANFLRSALNARLAPPAPDGTGAVPQKRGIPPKQFRDLLRDQMALLKIEESVATRYLNDGFSGGEKKRAEILQMAVLRPEIAILDETDSGLDIDALRIVSDGVNALAGPDIGVLVITHYQRILNYIKPHMVHIMLDGRIVTSGGPELALELETRGYDWLREKEVASR